MRIPLWLTLGAAFIVCVFGAYRIRLAFRSDDEDERAKARRGLFALNRRTHFLIGVIYILLGAGLVATSYGWNPLEGLIGPGRIVPAASPSGSGSGTTIELQRR